MRKLVLVVEDDNEIIEYLVEILQTFGIEAIVAVNGNEAFKLIEENIDELELVFLDMVLPDEINGIEIYDKIRDLSLDLPIIFMSGYPLAEFAFDDNLHFLPKPFSYDDIEIILENVNLS